MEREGLRRGWGEETVEIPLAGGRGAHCHVCHLISCGINPSFICPLCPPGGTPAFCEWGSREWRTELYFTSGFMGHRIVRVHLETEPADKRSQRSKSFPCRMHRTL